MSGESTFVLDSTVSPARSFALSFDPGAFDTLMDTQTLLKETFGLAMPEARGSPPRHAEEERRADPPAAAAVEEEEEEDGIVPYERERLERMRRHDEVMRRLGITESVNKLEGKAAPPPEKNPVIIIDDDEDDEAKNDTDDEDEEGEEDDDETGRFYGCKRCRSSRKGCYDTPDGKVKGCHPDAHLGPLYLQGLPKRVSVHADTPKKKRKVVYEHEVPPILSPRTKRPRLVPAKYEGGAAARADRASSPKVPPKPKEKELTLIPGLRYIFLTRYGRYAVHFWRRKGEWRQGKRSRYLGTVGTLKEAVEVYNKEARLLGKPTQEIPANYVAPEPDVPLTVTRAPKHTSSPDDKKEKEKRTTVPGYSGIRVSSTSGRFRVPIGGKPDRLCLGTVDTLREAVELYNMEAKKRGKPIHPLPDDELDVPELNNMSTVIPGLNNINFMTADGTFKMGFSTPSSGYMFSFADSLDEAVKAYNEARSECGRSTHTITAEHRAVVKEMQRKREVFIPKPPKKKRKMTARQYDKAHAAATTRLRPRLEPAAEKVSPPRAKSPKKPSGSTKESAPAEMTSTGGASAAAAAPAHLDQSAELDRLRDENEQLLEMNESLLAMAQRMMGMAARRAQATQ